MRLCASVKRGKRKKESDKKRCFFPPVVKREVGVHQDELDLLLEVLQPDQDRLLLTPGRLLHHRHDLVVAEQNPPLHLKRPSHLTFGSSNIFNSNKQLVVSFCSTMPRRRRDISLQK